MLCTELPCNEILVGSAFALEDNLLQIVYVKWGIGVETRIFLERVYSTPALMLLLAMLFKVRILRSQIALRCTFLWKALSN